MTDNTTTAASESPLQTDTCRTCNGTGKIPGRLYGEKGCPDCAGEVVNKEASPDDDKQAADEKQADAAEATGDAAVVVVVCCVCGREGHPQCGQDWWAAQRGLWRGNVATNECGDLSQPTETFGSACKASAASGTKSPRRASRRSRRFRLAEDTDSPRAGKHLAAPLTEQERTDLVNCLINGQGPYLGLSRAIPLEQAVHVAVEIWEDGDLEEGLSLNKLANVAQATGQELVDTTKKLGSNFARWSVGFFDSVQTTILAPPEHSTPRRSQVVKAAPDAQATALSTSLRNRGGIIRPGQQQGVS